MSGSFADLPKYPGESEDERAKLLAVLRPDAPAGPPDTFRQRVRHLLPALFLIAGLGFAGFVVLILGIVLTVKAFDSGIGAVVVLIGAFLALPAVAIGAAAYQRHRDRQKRGWS